MQRKLSLPSEEDFKHWLQDPVTEAVHRYMMDFREALAEAAVFDIVLGRILTSEEQAAIKAENKILADLATLEYSDMEKFYQDSEEANANSQTSG